VAGFAVIPVRTSDCSNRISSLVRLFEHPRLAVPICVRIQDA
jgi:hypothetical protein